MLGFTPPPMLGRSLFHLGKISEKTIDFRESSNSSVWLKLNDCLTTKNILIAVQKFWIHLHLYKLHLELSEFELEPNLPSIVVVLLTATKKQWTLTIWTAVTNLNDFKLSIVDFLISSLQLQYGSKTITRLLWSAFIFTFVSFPGSI